MDNNRQVIVTGGAGFIGSCVVRSLNDTGFHNILIVDHIASSEKWKNLVNKKYLSYVPKGRFLQELKMGMHSEAAAVIHLGACSSTTEKDFDYLWDNNVEYTKALWKYCSEKRIPFLYASSAATYGMGEQGFSDDPGKIDSLRPLNGYGYSKQAFDQWALRQETCPPQHVGLKFFNVYGPNEYCKGGMASMVFHGFRQVRENGKIRLFRSGHLDYADGEQERDFVYVKDVCSVILYFLEHPEYSGIFNVGTGRAQTFRELAESVFYALNLEPRIEYFDMPEVLRDKYQYHTQADISSLRSVGYTAEFLDVRQGVADYVQNYLDRGFEVY